jgi:hypothetical protein
VRYGAELVYTPDNESRKKRLEYDFWSCGTYQYADGGRRYLSEDWFFCQRWLDLGGEVFADTRVVLKHVGMAVYPLLTQEEEISGPAAAQPETNGPASEIAPAAGPTI